MHQIPAAASLIQSLWKCYAADKSFESKATWKIHLREPVQSTNNAWKEVREEGDIITGRVVSGGLTVRWVDSDLTCSAILLGK